MPRISSSLNKRNSFFCGPSSSLTAWPPNSGSKTLSPALTPTCVMSKTRDVRMENSNVPFGMIFPSMGLGRPGPTATTTPALSCIFRGEKHQEKSWEKSHSSITRTITTPFHSFRSNELNNSPPKRSRRARTRSQHIRPERTTKTTTRERAWRSGGKKKRRKKKKSTTTERETKKRTLLPTVSGNKIPPLVFVAATALSTKTLSSSGINFFAAWLIFFSLSLSLFTCTWVDGFFCDDLIFLPESIFLPQQQQQTNASKQKVKKNKHHQKKNILRLQFNHQPHSSERYF